MAKGHKIAVLTPSRELFGLSGYHQTGDEPPVFLSLLRGHAGEAHARVAARASS